jgi:DNA helicase HerA-like ATPase
MSEVPGVSRSRPATRHVPSGLSGEGPLLGRKKDSRKEKEVRLHPEDMFHHVYVLGQTGTGKTTMLGSMIEERLQAGAGLGLIDPHGDLYDRVRRAVPAGRRGDVVLFNPTDPGNDAALNLLEYDPERPRQRSRLINELFQIFDQEYDLKRTGGPMFEKYMRSALLLVMNDPREPGTLPDVVRLFQDEEYRETLLQACDNERVVQFWRQAESTPDAGDLPSPNNMAIYVTSKLSRFVDDDYLRSLVNQRHSTLDFRQVIDSGKILLVKMTKGRLGQIGIRMFGTIIITRLMMAALAREEIPEEERRDFYLFVDEFQNFTTPTIASLLSEARKYRLSLTLANQTLYQLEDEIADAVLGNAGSLVALRPGVKDFGRIEPYVSPPFSREEITNLPNYKAVGRLLAGGEPTRPFLFETTPRL